MLWHAELRDLTFEPQRIEALKRSLDSREDGYYYPFAALSYLAKLGDEAARAALEEKLAESERRSLSAKLLEETRTTLNRVDLQIRLRDLEPAAQARELAAALATTLPDRSFPGRRYQVWLLRQLGERGAAREAEEALRQVAGNAALGEDLRHEATQLLGARGAPRPEVEKD